MTPLTKSAATDMRLSNDQYLWMYPRPGDVRRRTYPEMILKSLRFCSSAVIGVVLREGAPVLTVAEEVDQAKEPLAAAGGSLLDELAHASARAMLAAELQAEVAACKAAHACDRDAGGRRLVVRNDKHQPRVVVTAAGAVRVRRHRVNDKRVDPATGERSRFSTAIVPAWALKSPSVTEALPLLYLHGLTSHPRWSSSWAQARACHQQRSHA